jgi:hypothetical protein
MFCYIRPKITASSSNSVGLAALLSHGITPQDVYHLVRPRQILVQSLSHEKRKERRRKIFE